jgi:2',3'-cyclic-nucleotide 2'-phosphodiesterase (5'-nucleotidase family)
VEGLRSYEKYVRLRPSTVGIVALATVACARGVGRTEPGGVSPQLAVSAPRVAKLGARELERSLVLHDSQSQGMPSVRTRSIGHCDPAQMTSGKARFTIAHFNDLQARYSDRLEGKSRYAYLAGYLEKLQKDVPETIVLDAGDDYEKGSVAELRSGGETTRQMIQALPIDVRTIGNHDFAYGEQAVLRDVSLSAHPVLAANVTVEKLGDNEQPLARFVRIDVGCVRVGVVGLVTQSYDADDRPTKKPFDAVFEQSTSYAKILEREVAEHRPEVDVMIALTHLGLWDDTALAMSTGAKGVDLVVGAHTEDLLERPLPAMRPDGSRTWIMQAGHYGRTLGRADLVVDLEKKRVSFERYEIVKVDASLPVDEDVATLADRLESEAAPDAREPLATTRRELSAGRDMMELVAHAAASEWGADALLLGRDVFWSGLPKGPVTLQRMYDSVLVQRQPSGTSGFTSLFLVDVTGAQLSALRARMQSPLHEMLVPAKLDPARTYKLAIEKRALTYPKAVFGGDPKLPSLADASLGGELIDVLEAYARSRAAKGEALD